MTEITNHLSRVPLKIKMYHEDTYLALGTAFLYKYNDGLYLVTNGHNVTGIHPDTNEYLHSEGGWPTRILIDFSYQNTDNNQTEWGELGFNLYIDDEPIWNEHPTYKRKVDVVTINLLRLDFENLILPNQINNQSSVKYLQHTLPANINYFSIPLIKRAGMDVFVLGFPLGWTGGAKYPIWKRASLASEPLFDLDGLPKMYIDTATRQGMSGSPVFAKDSGNFFLEGSDTSDPLQMKMGEAYRFLGVYSGRIGNHNNKDEFSAQLGIVWKESVIREIIEATK